MLLKSPNFREGDLREEKKTTLKQHFNELIKSSQAVFRFELYFNENVFERAVSSKSIKVIKTPFKHSLNVIDYWRVGFYERDFLTFVSRSMFTCLLLLRCEIVIVG